MALVALSLAWATGVFLGSLCEFLPGALLIVVLPLLLLPVGRFRKKALFSSLCLLTIFLGNLYYQSSLPPQDSTQVSYYNDSGKVSLKGVVSLDPEVQDKTTRLKLAVESIEIDGEWQPVSGMVMLYTEHYPAYGYGDLVEVSGKLETPQNFADFDYQSYLAKQSVYSTMLYPQVTLIDTGHASKVLGWIYELRHKLADVMARTLPEPQASLAQGIILGMRGNIPDDVNDDFARSGITHVLAISGANLSIIATLLALVLNRIIGKRFYLYVWLTLAAVWFYTVISGASPSVMRAAVMVSLFLLAELLGRQKHAATALCLAGAIMILGNPLVLWDVSFQLSVLSMAGIIFIYPLLREAVTSWKERIQKRRMLPGATLGWSLDSLAMTLAATLAVWPASAAYFGMLSLAAPIATLLAIWVLPCIMVLGSLSAISGIIYLPLGQVLAWGTWLLATYLLLIARVFAHLPVVSLGAGNINTVLIIIYYGLIILGVWILMRRRRIKFMAEMGLLAA